MASTTARGYSYDHQRLRAALLPYAYGKDSQQCGLPVERGQDHDSLTCNKSPFPTGG